MITEILLIIQTVASTGNVWTILGPILYGGAGALILFLLNKLWNSVGKVSDKSDDIIKEMIKGIKELNDEKNTNIHGRIDETNKRVNKNEELVEKLVTELKEYTSMSKQYIGELQTVNEHLTENKESDRKTFLEAFNTSIETLRVGIDDPILQADLKKHTKTIVKEQLGNLIEEGVSRALKDIK